MVNSGVELILTLHLSRADIIGMCHQHGFYHWKCYYRKLFLKFFFSWLALDPEFHSLGTCSANKLTFLIVKISYDHLWHDVKSSWTYPSLHSSLKDSGLGGQSEKTLELGWPDSSPTTVANGWFQVSFPTALELSCCIGKIKPFYCTLGPALRLLSSSFPWAQEACKTLLLVLLHRWRNSLNAAN